MPGVETVSEDGLHLHAENIRSIIPLDFPVLRGLIRSALATLAPARANPSRYIPILTEIIHKLTICLWFSPNEMACGLRPYEQFDDATRAIVTAFTDAMDQAMQGLMDMVCDLFLYFLVAQDDRRLYPVFEPDYTFDVMEAQLKDAWALFENA
jgi:hypothetical protein